MLIDDSGQRKKEIADERKWIEFLQKYTYIYMHEIGIRINFYICFYFDELCILFQSWKGSLTVESFRIEPVMTPL